MSKGSSPRPHDPAKFRSEWERIFSRHTPLESPEKDALDEHTRLWADEYQARRTRAGWEHIFIGLAEERDAHPAREEEDTTREEA